MLRALAERSIFALALIAGLGLTFMALDRDFGNSEDRLGHRLDQEIRRRQADPRLAAYTAPTWAPGERPEPAGPEAEFDRPMTPSAMWVSTASTRVVP